MHCLHTNCEQQAKACQQAKAIRMGTSYNHLSTSLSAGFSSEAEPASSRGPCISIPVQMLQLHLNSCFWLLSCFFLQNHWAVKPKLQVVIICTDCMDRHRILRPHRMRCVWMTTSDSCQIPGAFKLNVHHASCNGYRVASFPEQGSQLYFIKNVKPSNKPANPSGQVEDGWSKEARIPF